MNDMEAKLRELFSDRARIEKLFLLEKERRGVQKNNLVFLGMANIAEYFWCAMKAVLKSKSDELGFFSAYLQDRIRYSHRLGLIDSLPNRDKDLLEIGNKVAFNDVQKLLKEEESGILIEQLACEITDQQGNRVMVLNPDLSPEEKKRLEKEAKAKGIKIADLEKFPKLRGELLESTREENYPSIRWNFEWKKYVVVGVPDGITDKFVYEFKTSRNRFLMNFVKPVALTQADLYGYFFKRNNKRVQINIINEGNTETWESEIDKSRAETALTDFSRVDGGWNPPPPRPWKCKNCEFKSTCPMNPPSQGKREGE